MPPLVSVIIPARDREHRLRKAIESVLLQSMSDFEVIVVDDDSRADLAVDVGRTVHDARLQFIRQDHAGPARARNNGAAHAEGTYLAFLDSDDIWYPQKLEKQLAAFTRDPGLALVGCGVRFLGTGGEEIAIRIGQSPWSRIWQLLSMVTSSIVVRKEVFRSEGRFSEDLFFLEDKELFLRLGLAHPFEVVREVLVDIVRHAETTTGQAWKDLSWVERYERDVIRFWKRVRPRVRVFEIRHLARKVSILNTDLAGMYADHGRRKDAARCLLRAALLSPQEIRLHLQTCRDLFRR